MLDFLTGKLYNIIKRISHLRGDVGGSQNKGERRGENEREVFRVQAD